MSAQFLFRPEFDVKCSNLPSPSCWPASLAHIVITFHGKKHLCTHLHREALPDDEKSGQQERFIPANEQTILETSERVAQKARWTWLRECHIFSVTRVLVVRGERRATSIKKQTHVSQFVLSSLHHMCLAVFQYNQRDLELCPIKPQHFLGLFLEETICCWVSSNIKSIYWDKPTCEWSLPRRTTMCWVCLKNTRWVGGRLLEIVNGWRTDVWEMSNGGRLTLWMISGRSHCLFFRWPSPKVNLLTNNQ